jgi:predicted GNAT family N-acyltransferase
MNEASVIQEAPVIQRVAIFKGESDPALLKRIEAFRLKVWSECIGVRLAVKRFGLDSFDYKAWHIAYLEEGSVIASGRLIMANCQSGVPDLCSFSPFLGLMEYPIGILNRLVVDRMYRGRGMATSINRDRIRLAREHGVTDLWVEIQLHRVPSMGQLGFYVVGPSQDKSIAGDWCIMRRNT